MSPFDALPPLGPGVRTIVVIPARDEAESIGAALAALAAQRTPAGAKLDPRTYETIVFANACCDATARVARAQAGGGTVHVVEADVEPGAHVGDARRALMDAAAARFVRAGRSDGTIASTDADTVVAPDWIAALRAAVGNGADAVLGRVVISRADRAALDPDAARLYLWDMAYRRVLALAESAFDPVPWDPAPRHGMAYAASLAVRADTYLRAGGLPALARGEDLAFYSRLVGIDARVRHSLRVRVATSPRACGRVEGGFATLMRQLHEAAGPEQWLVEQPEETLRRIGARAALRRYHAARDASAYRDVLEGFELDFSAFSSLYDPSDTFGRNLQRVEDDAMGRGVYDVYRRVPVARAISVLRAASAAPSRSAMRTSVASGAG